MLIDSLRDQWIGSCGNWVDRIISWCPDWCEENVTIICETERSDEVNTVHIS
jgi:hypothetical protein